MPTQTACPIGIAESKHTVAADGADAVFIAMYAGSIYIVCHIAVTAGAGIGGIALRRTSGSSNCGSITVFVVLCQRQIRQVYRAGCLEETEIHLGSIACSAAIQGKGIAELTPYAVTTDVAVIRRAVGELLIAADIVEHHTGLGIHTGIHLHPVGQVVIAGGQGLLGGDGQVVKTAIYGHQLQS